jgi:hypothetical protein
MLCKAGLLLSLFVYYTQVPFNIMEVMNDESSNLNVTISIYFPGCHFLKPSKESFR